ncbi:MarR family transcriptional regulator [Leptospira langatensis]|uniref:MarR family transcriptional regulator n=1 Tax=Leptospira langatensis TaxID=2484983 RepID=A0A5F1ZT10_9LEPT|nr:MarR family transcriptional regulator [Leptospira langatensis]TGK00176.1 MarR family transcriptional regulator [Leptospira langatensis]TGL41194.1 MarR family transcriptional regulator [Leptospira langatensis]
MSKDKVSRYEKSEESPGFLLWQVTNLWQRGIRKVLEPLGLTHPQFVLLTVTHWLETHGEETTQIRIADQAKTDPMTTSQVLRTLEGKKFVKRSAHGTDTRAKIVLTTAEGQKLLKQAIQAVEDFDEEFFTVLGTNRKGFLSSLGILSQQ